MSFLTCFQLYNSATRVIRLRYEHSFVDSFFLPSVELDEPLESFGDCSYLDMKTEDDDKVGSVASSGAEFKVKVTVQFQYTIYSTTHA